MQTIVTTYNTHFEGEVFLEERNNTWNTPFLFNGKELDEETGLYYYGARYYNPRVSLWYGVDPLFDKYPAYSPYCYTMNNPINAIDPDGKVVVFVNGLAKRGTISIASLFSPKPKKAYWGESFLEGATFYFKDKNLQYTNGSGKTMFSTAKRRMRRGEKYAYKQIELATQGKESIFNGMVSKGEDGELNWTDETIKLVTHSHGAAFGEGMSRALQKSGANIEEVVNVAPHGKFEVSNLPNTTQVNVKGDPVSRKSGRGEALQGTDTNITKKSDTFLKGYDKVKYRHAIPIHTGKTFDIIKNETKQ